MDKNVPSGFYLGRFRAPWWLILRRGYRQNVRLMYVVQKSGHRQQTRAGGFAIEYQRGSGDCSGDATGSASTTLPWFV